MKTKTIIVWEVGDTVEEIATGHKGIVTGHIGNMPNVRHTSPCEFDKCAYDADDLRPWQPGYGYMPNGDRVPDKDGWEMVPEGELHNIDGDIAICGVDGDWRKFEYYCYSLIVSEVQTGAVRAVYRRKQPALQVCEGAYYRRRDGKVTTAGARKSGSCSRPWIVDGNHYTDDGFRHFKGYDARAKTIETDFDLIAEVPAPEPQMVKFDSEGDLPEWETIYVRWKKFPRKMHIMTYAEPSGISVQYRGGIYWKELFDDCEISPDRRNWQVAGKQI